MTTRRDVLRIGALGSAAMPAITPSSAMRLLFGGAAPIAEPFAGPRGIDDPADIGDPVRFARSVERGLGDVDRLSMVAPEELAAYHVARHAAYASLGGAARLPVGHPLVELDETSCAAFCALFDAGLRMGAAAGNLRLALVGPREMCRTCQGLGLVGADGRWLYEAEPNPTPCPTCRGSGLVAFAGVADGRRAA